MRYFVSIVLLLSASAAVIVNHSDINQTGAFPDTTLTTSNVNTATFGKVWSYSIDVPVFAQPLGVPSVTVNGTQHDLLIVATMTNKIYAFDANASGPALWTTVLGQTRQLFPSKGLDNETVLTDVGVLSTPVVDSTAGFIYVVGATPVSWRLFKLSLTNGTIQSQVDITGQVTGTGDTGDTVVAGQLQFNAAQHFQRPGLVIANSKVYVAFGGISDLHPWHGWIFAYNTADLSQAAVFCTTPNSFGGAIWQSGGAPAIDGSGNVYVTTGNDNSLSDGTNFGETVLKLSPMLSVLDWFTPSTFAALDTSDADISSNRAILIPGTNFVVISGKNFFVYVVDTTCMGHLQGSNINCALLSFQTNAAGTINSVSGAYSMALDSTALYVPTTAGSLYQFLRNGSSVNATPALTQTPSYGYPGHGSVSLSNGIVWSVTSSSTSEFKPSSSTLRAIRASDFTEIWNSDTTAGDTLGHMAKFVSPLIFNGRVYEPNQDGQIQVYGLH